MTLTLAENIRALRKGRKLTQEQFAEVMGVTPGAVYKWEAGLSVPELNMIVEMADFFDRSVDALLGYQMKDNRLDAVGERLASYCRTRDPEALVEAEKALKKYPNSFRIVLGCAQVYAFYGVGSEHRKEARRALELYEQARLLIAQNTDPRISELTICGDMANVYMAMGEVEKGVALQKEHNANGVFSHVIGATLALNMGRFEEAEPFLAEALLRGAISLIDAVAGYVLLFCDRGDFDSAQEILTWGGTLLKGLKQEGAPDGLDKVYVIWSVLQAHVHMQTNTRTAAREALQEALQRAVRFDSDADYSLSSLRFIRVKDSSAISDGLGATAMDSLESAVRLMKEPALTDLWKEVRTHA